jgi:DNA ligase-1
LGAIICEGVDNERNIRVNVGSGLSDANRDEYWLARDQLLGNVVEVEADAVTQNQDGSYSLRFPRFVRFRGFEAGEKL